MKRIFALIFALLLITGVMAGCGQKSEGTAQKDTASAVSTEKVQDTQDNKETAVYPIKVKDNNGTDVTIEKEPVQIVSLSLGTDEMLFSLVDKSRIKSLTQFADDPGVSNVAEEAKAVPARTDANAEKIIALQPDLVLVDTWADKGFVQQLRDADITVYAFKTPSNVDEQKKVILDISHAVGADAKGKELVAWMDGKLKEVADKLSQLKPEEKLAALDYSEMGSTSGKGTNFDDLLTHAGIINAAAQAGMEGWPQLAKEKVVELNPDIVFLPGWLYDKNKTPDSYAKEFKNDKSYAGLKAVKNNRVLMLPYNHISAISQYIVLGIEDAAKAAYPQLFK